MIFNMNGGFSAHIDLDVDKPIYRIINCKYLLESLKQSAMYFHRVNLWDDTWEIPSRFWKSVGEGVAYSKIELSQLSARALYGNCWTSDIESDAMWRIYSPNKDGIAIQTTIRRLFKEIDYNHFIYNIPCIDGFIGPVRYEVVDGTDFFDDAAYFYPEYMMPSFIKRCAFAHEKEIRFLLYMPNYLYYYPNNEVGLTEDKTGVHLPMLENSYIEKLILDPRLSRQEALLYHHTLDEFNIPVDKSPLYEVPEATTDYVLSTEQCKPFCLKNQQRWDMKKCDFIRKQDCVKTEK